MEGDQFDAMSEGHGEGDNPSVVKSAGRIIRILECFAEYQRPLRMGEIARELNLPSSSTSVLLRSLVQLGYCTLDPQTRSFLPTRRVRHLGSWLEGNVEESNLVRLMEELSRRTNETVILGEEIGLHVQYTRVIQGVMPLRFHVRAGTKRLLHSANLGIAILSKKADDVVGRILRRISAERQTDDPRVDEKYVWSQIIRCRSDGYVYIPNAIVPGAGVIASPLKGLDSEGLAIGIGGSVERFTKSEGQIAKMIKEAISIYNL